MDTLLKCYKIGFACLILAACYSCRGNQPETGDDTAVNAQTPVTITTIGSSALADSMELNAISSFLQKNYIKANAIGYIQRVAVQPAIIYKRAG